MGVSYSTARWLAPASFLVDFACQNYGSLVTPGGTVLLMASAMDMSSSTWQGLVIETWLVVLLSTPNMKDIHDANPSFFSPQPFFIAGFFFPQQLFQVGWLYRLWKLDPSKPAERAELDQMIDFVPYYSIGNLCIASWMIFWNSSRLDISHAFVTINTATQLYYIFAKLQPMNTKSKSSILTHVVSKTFAGIGVLDFLHNWSAAFRRGQSASTLIKALTGVGFGLGGLASDWIFGGCLVYDLVALAVGQRGDWRTLLGIYALGTAGIVTAKNIARPPYIQGYSLAPADDIV